jgi:hypothetical protein
MEPSTFNSYKLQVKYKATTEALKVKKNWAGYGQQGYHYSFHCKSRCLGQLKLQEKACQLPT